MCIWKCCLKDVGYFVQSSVWQVVYILRFHSESLISMAQSLQIIMISRLVTDRLLYKTTMGFGCLEGHKFPHSKGSLLKIISI